MAIFEGSLNRLSRELTGRGEECCSTKIFIFLQLPSAQNVYYNINATGNPAQFSDAWQTDE
jgi:hypothetical protein